jgi:uncharacterized lipoprotein YbaY
MKHPATSPAGRPAIHLNADGRQSARIAIYTLLCGIVALCLVVPAAAASKIAASGRYFCDDGSAVTFTQAAYGTSMMRDGREVRLAPRAAFRGFSYKGGGLSLRGRGVEGKKTLSVEAADLKIACNALPSIATPGVAAGTIATKLAMRLPPGAVLTVAVRDTARTDAAAPLLGQVRMTVGKARQPLHWWLRYDAVRGVQPARPALWASITDTAGNLLWTSDALMPVPAGTKENFAQAEISMVPVAP